MGICGCSDRCTCSLVGCNGITIIGSGDPVDPYTICAPDETVFDAQSLDNSINITPGGLYGHTPNLGVSISGNAGNLLENDGTGLYVGDASAANAAIPIGASFEFTHDNLDPGFLWEDGSDYLVADYSALASKYGATGVGDGLHDNHPQLGLPAAGRFRVPDSVRRAVYNVNGTDVIGDSDAIAVASRNPSHTHTGPSHSHGPGTLTGSTAAIPSASGLAVGQGTQQSAGVNDDIVGGEAWLNVTSAVLPAVPAVPTNNSSGDAEGPGRTGNIPLGDHTHGTPSTTVSVTGGSTAAAGTGATGSKSPGHIYYKRAVFAGA